MPHICHIYATCIWHICGMYVKCRYVQNICETYNSYMIILPYEPKYMHRIRKNQCSVI